MHLLLPPSETKSTGGRGRPVRGRLDDTALGRARVAACTALQQLLELGDDAAAQALQLPAGVATEALRADSAVLDSPTTPALDRYRGVLYDGLDHAGLDRAEQRTAGRSVLIFSGLFGVVGGAEGVPAYRVPGKALLPGLGVASTFWRSRLVDVVPAMVRSGLIVDLRSADYAAMWRPVGEPRSRTVAVRVLSPLPGGRHAVVSYASKFAKGRLAAALIRRHAAGAGVGCVDDVAEAWRSCGGFDHVRTATGVDVYTR